MVLSAPPPTDQLAQPLADVFEDPLSQYLATLHSNASRRSVLSVLGRAARILAQLDGAPNADEVDARSYPWGAPGALSYGRVNTVVAIVGEGGHAPVARLTRAALRGVARAAHNLKLLSIDDRVRIQDVPAPKLSKAMRGRRLTEKEVEQLFAACFNDPSALGRRDAALLAVMLGTGLRRFEASGLDLADYRRPQQVGIDVVRLVVRSGKGGRYDEVIGPPDVAPAIEDWLVARGEEPGALFFASPGRGRQPLAGRRLSPSGVYDALVRRAFHAGIAETAPHDLRRTMITEFLERTGDLALAQRAARHQSPATTARYDKRGETALARAIAGARSGYELASTAPQSRGSDR